MTALSQYSQQAPGYYASHHSRPDGDSPPRLPLSLILLTQHMQLLSVADRQQDPSKCWPDLRRQTCSDTVLVVGLFPLEEYLPLNLGSDLHRHTCSETILVVGLCPLEEYLPLDLVR